MDVVWRRFVPGTKLPAPVNLVPGVEKVAGT